MTAPGFRWRLTGTEWRPEDEPRRDFDVIWLDPGGLRGVTVASTWMVDAVQRLHGQEASVTPTGPVFTVDAADQRLAYWAAYSLAAAETLVAVSAPDPLPDPTPDGAPN